MLRMAAVRQPDERDDHIVHAVGAGFTDIDAEMRESLAKNQACPQKTALGNVPEEVLQGA